MRYLVAPALASKIASSSTLAAALAAFISKIENWKTKDEAVFDQSVSKLFDSELFTFSAGTNRIFFSFLNDKDGEYILGIDIVGHSSAVPKGSALNPYYSKNPKHNATINPNFNANINPNFNASINPKFNASINPQFNASINPQFNASINPKWNWSLNPFNNLSFDGPFLFDLAINAIGFVVRANETVWLLFNSKLENTGFAVRHASDGFVVFSKDSEWVEHWADNKNGGFLRYDPQNQWLGFVA